MKEKETLKQIINTIKNVNFNKLYGADYRRDLADHIVCILQLEVGQTFSTADEIIKQLNDKNISDFIVAHNYISEYIKSDNQEYFKLEKFFKPEKYKPKEIWLNINGVDFCILRKNDEWFYITG